MNLWLILLIIIGLLILIPLLFRFINFAGVKILSSSAEVVESFTDKYDYDRYHSIYLLIYKEQKTLNIIIDKLNPLHPSLSIYKGEMMKVYYKKGRNEKIKIIRYEPI